MNKIIQRVFSVQHMLKPHQRAGQLEDSKSYYHEVVRMAWPSALESVLMSLIGSMDLIMVGGLGAAAISAVGITNQPKFILLAIIFSLNTAVTAIVARRRGENNMESANRCLRQSILLSIGLSVLMGTLGFVFARPLMEFAGAEADYVDYAVEYFQIIVVSVVFNGVSTTINSAQRGAGNTKISLRTNLTANIVNIIFNQFLINGLWIFPKMGVQGAAIATAIGSAVGCALSVMSLLRQDTFLTLRDKTPWRFDRQTIALITKISSAAMAEQAFMRIGFFAYAKIVAGLGTVAFATHQICMNIIGLSFSFGDGLSIAASALVGQSLGRKRPDEAIVYGKTGQRVAFMISSALFLLFLFGGRFLVSFFSSDLAILNLGASIMAIIAFSTHFQTSQVVCSGCLRGAGDTKFVAITSFISIGVLRPFLTWFLAYPMGWGLIGAWIPLLIDQSIRLLFSFRRFSKGKWTRIKI